MRLVSNPTCLLSSLDRCFLIMDSQLKYRC